jgi:hypothetical protein
MAPCRVQLAVVSGRPQPVRYRHARLPRAVMKIKLEAGDERRSMARNGHMKR